MQNKILEKFLKVKSSTISDMKNLLEDVKSCKNEKLEQEVEKLKKELQEVKKLKKYGLVWEEKVEKFDEDTVGKLPVLKEIKKYDIKKNDSENNILIEGDNYHTLSVLNYTHKGKIDIIYIDPPYNTGNNDFIYNDRIIDKEDKFRHSKWLSFMNKRLKLAKNLLSEKGVILFSIDQNEFAQLKLLCDEIFGQDNFIGNIAVVNNLKGRSDDNHLATAHEFTFIYSKNIDFLNFNGIKLSDEKINEYKLSDNISKFKKILLRKTGKGWKREDRPNMFYPIYFNEKLNEISLERREGFVEILPFTKDLKEGRWRWGKDTFMKKYNTEIIIEKNKNLNYVVYTKMRLTIGDKVRTLKVKSIFLDPKYDSGNGTSEIKNILGEGSFTNPKPKNFIKDLLIFSSNKNSTIFDFFAGSGTTGHAVMELNKEDGGNRKFILATNNENGICEEVTYERVKRVMNGYENLKGEKVEGLGGNLKYLKTDFIDKDNSNDDLRKRMVDRCSELLCLKENIWCPASLPLGETEGGQNNKIKIFERKDKYLAILYDMFFIGDFIKILNNLEEKNSISIYAFSHYKVDREDFEELKGNFEIEEIPDPILEVYDTIFGL